MSPAPRELSRIRGPGRVALMRPVRRGRGERPSRRPPWSRPSGRWPTPASRTRSGRTKPRSPARCGSGRSGCSRPAGEVGAMSGARRSRSGSTSSGSAASRRVARPPGEPVLLLDGGAGEVAVPASRRVELPGDLDGEVRREVPGGGSTCTRRRPRARGSARTTRRDGWPRRRSVTRSPTARSTVGRPCSTRRSGAGRSWSRRCVGCRSVILGATRPTSRVAACSASTSIRSRSARRGWRSGWRSGARSCRPTISSRTCGAATDC